MSIDFPRRISGEGLKDLPVEIRDPLNETFAAVDENFRELLNRIKDGIARDPNVGNPYARPLGAKARGFHFVGASEFQLDGREVFWLDPSPNPQEPVNGFQDFFVDGNDRAGSTTPDITYALDNLEARFPQARRALLWVQWFMQPSVSFSNIYPAVNQGVQDYLEDPTDWSVNGLDASTATVLNDGLESGTAGDDGYLWAFNELKSRGIAVGVYPIVRGDPPDELRWRGEIQFGDNTDFANFLTGYEAFIKYYVDLMKANVDLGNDPPDWFVIGSEMQSATIYDTSGDGSGFEFVDLLIDLAAYVKSQLPNTLVMYAGLWTEYGFRDGSDGGYYFPLDRLYADANFDVVGINAYLPLADRHITDYGQLKKAVTDDPEWTYAALDSKPDDWGVGGNTGVNSKLDGSGHSAGTKPALLPQNRRKDILGWRSSYHYEYHGDREFYFRDTETRTLKLQVRTGGSTNPSATSPLFDALPGGVWEDGSAPALNDTYILFDSTESQYLDGVAPDLSSGPGYEFELRLRLEDDVLGQSYMRIMRIAGILDVFYDNSFGTITAEIFTTGGSEYAGVSVTAGVDSTYRIQVNDDLSWEVWVDGSSVNSGTLSNAPLRPNGEAMYFASYSGGNDFFEGRMYWWRFEDIGVAEYTWELLDQHLGFVTAWEPDLKPIMLTEVGMTSVNSAPVEPDMSPHLRGAYGELQGQAPYNSTFAVDQVVQAVALHAQLDVYNEWEDQGLIDGYFIFGYDVRPPEYIRDTFFWDPDFPNQVTGAGGWRPHASDRNEFVLTHFVNGKLAERTPPVFPDPNL